MARLNFAPIARLPVVADFTWKKLLLLAGLGVATGLGLALIIRPLPVS